LQESRFKGRLKRTNWRGGRREGEIERGTEEREEGRNREREKRARESDREMKSLRGCSNWREGERDCL
jgi:hypothetical protein